MLERRDRNVYIPFTKDVHELLIAEGHTHIFNKGLITDLIDNATNETKSNYAILALAFVSRYMKNKTFVFKEYGFIEIPPDGVKMTDIGILFPVMSKNCKEMYLATYCSFYLCLDLHIECYYYMYLKINRCK